MTIAKKCMRKAAQKKQLKSDRMKLSVKIVSSMLAAGFLMSGFGLDSRMIHRAEASNIKPDGAAALSATNNVFNIYAQQIDGDGAIATNRFTDFDLTGGQIANMYFKISADASKEASALFNFVKNDINIAGTVNAVKDNKIGGELFFITPGSIVVSGSGVINAGAITLMSGGPYPSSADAAYQLAQEVQNGTYLPNDKEYGSITVAGKLNATEYISLVSSKTILLQREVTNGTVTGKGELKTHTEFDFGELVNIKNADGTAMVANSDLDTTTGNLTLTRGSGQNGNIRLQALAMKTNHNGDPVQKMDVIGENTVKADITIDAGTVINANGGLVDIDATALRDHSLFGNYPTFGDAGAAEASVTINGTVTGDNVSVVAQAQNIYKKGAWETLTSGLVKGQLKTLINDYVGDIGDIALAFLGQRTKSTVTFGGTAEVTATGKDSMKDDKTVEALRVSATTKSQLRSNVNASSDGSAQGRNYIGADFLYGYVENEATINVDNGAKLSAVGATGTDKSSIKLAAAAETEAMLTASTKATEKLKPDGSIDPTESDKIAATAILINLGNTKAKVNVAQGAELTAQDDLTLTAETSHDTCNEAAVTSKDTTFVSTALQLTDMDSAAAVTANGTLKATRGKLTLKAEDSASVDAYANNSVEHQLEQSALDMYSNWTTDKVNELADTFIKKLKFKYLGIVQKNNPKIADNAFSLGASIDVAAGNHTAEVNVGEMAQLTSGGDMALAAKQTMTDVNVVAQGASSGNNKGAVINASLLYAGLNSRAAVNVKGTADTETTTGSGAQLTAGGNMQLQAETTYKWDRVKASMDFIVDRWKTFAATYENLAENFTMKKFDDAVNEYESNQTDENYKKIAQIAGSNDFVHGLSDLVKVGFKSPNDLANLIRAVESFLDGSTYVNINAGSVATTSTDGDTKPKADVAVAIAVEDFTSKAAVVVGDKAQLTAGGSLTAEADAEQLEVNYYGAMQGLAKTLDNAGVINENLKMVLEADELDLGFVPAWNSGDNAVGGTISWSNNNVESGVIVAEAAKLEGSSVSLKADTDVKRVLVNLGGSVGGNTGFTGILTGVEGKTNSFVVVDDEAALLAKNKDGVTLTADNDALIFNGLGGLTMGSTSIGASVGSVNNDMNTIAAVADNDNDAARASGSEAENLNELIRSFLTSEQEATLGLAATKVTNGEIKTAALAINAESSPVIWDVAVAGAVTKKESEEPAGDDDVPGGMIKPNGLALDKNDNGNQANLNEAGANPVQEPISGKSIAGAGAVSVQQLHGTTATLLENAKVNLLNDVADSTKSVALQAYENGQVVGLDGALSLKTSGSEGKTTVSVAGTSAYNDISMDVISQIKGSTITNAAAISNYAQQDESLVAVAVPVSMDVSGEDAKGFSTALNLSVNKVDNKVHANLKDNTVQQSEGVSGTTNIQNVAYDTSAQVTGGVNVDQARTTVGLGINAVWAQLNNDVSATVEGGNYKGIGTFANEAVTAMKQVSLSVGVGIGTGETSRASLGAVWTHARLNNSVSANLKNTSISGTSLTNRAYDGEVAAGSGQTTKWRNVVQEMGVDVNGTGTEGVLDGAQTTDVDTDVLDGNVTLAGTINPHGQALPEGGSDKTYTNESLSFNTNKGNKIYTGAIEIIGSTAAASKATLGVAVADSTVDNDYTAAVSGLNATLSCADGLAVLAKTDSYLANFAVGVAVAKNDGSSVLNGAGSIAVSKMDNDTVASITGSTISAAKTETKAETTSTTAGVAGSLGYGDGRVGVGLSVAVNKLDNETKAAVYSSTLKGYNGGSTALTIDARNTGKLFALGLGITAASGDNSYLAAQGNVATNSGKVDTVAEMDKQSGGSNNAVEKVSSVQIKATDETTQTAAAAGLGISTGKATAGLGFAVNEITGQTLAARLNNAAITAAEGGADIDVTTDEKMKLVTVAAGVGAGNNEWGAFEGYAAINKTKNKQNTAELVGTTLTDAAQGSDVLVKAVADNKVVSNADAVSVNVSSDSRLSAGLAVSTIDLKSNVTAKVDASTLSAKDVEVKAKSDDKMYNVSVGVGGSGSKVNAAGSISANSLTNNVSANVNASTIKALNSVGVLADSRERMVNVTGGLSIGVKSSLGLGLSVAVNDFAGDTVAKVSGSTIEALGGGTKTLTAHQFTTDDKNKMSITADSEDAATADKAKHKGLVVDAYSNHDSNDVVFTLGVAAGSKDIAVGLTGTGSSEKLTGKTEALVEKTDINKGRTDQGDVTVTALEKTDLDAVDVNVSVAAGGESAVSVGAGVSVATLDRDVNAKLVAEPGQSKTVQADKLTVEAGAKSDAKLVTVGVDVGGSKGVGFGVGAVVDSLTSIYDVNAEISNITGSNNGLTLRAAHDGMLDYEGVGVVIGGGEDGGAAVGAVVGVMKDESTVTGTVRNVTQNHRDTSARDVLAVTNYGESTPDLVSVNLSGGLFGAGSVGIIVDNHKLNDSLRLELDQAHLGSAEHRAAQADLIVNNNYKLDKDTANVTVAGALVSGAVGVTTHPITINSSNVLNVTGSELYAGTLNLINNEQRYVHIAHSSFTGALELQVGVAYTHLTMGGQLENSYATSKNDADTNKKSQEDLLEKLNIVNKAVDGAESTLQKGVSGSAAALPDGDSKASINNASLATGGHYADQGTVSAEGQLLRASNSTFVADDINLSSTVKDDIKVYSGSGGLGAVSVNVNMATVDETIKNKIELVGGSLAAKNISVLNNVTGNTNVHAAIGNVGIVSINLGYADVYAKGESSVAIDGTTLLAKEGLLLRSLHDSIYESYTQGGGLELVKGSYTEAESKDSIENSVSVQNATLTVLDKKTAAVNTTDTTAAKAVKGALEIAAVKSSQAKSKTMYGGVTGIGVGANSSTAKIDGKSTITFNSNKVYDSYTSGGKTQRGENTALDLYALYNSRAVTDMTYGSGDIVAGGGGVAGHATSRGGAEIIARNNTLDVANVSAATMVGGKEDLASVTAQAYNISVGLSVGVNNIDATVDTTSTVDFKDNIFGRTEIKTIKDTVYRKNETTGNYEPVHTYTTSETGKANLSLSARTDGTANAELLGVSVAGVFSVGHNKATTKTTEKTMVNLDNSGLTGDAAKTMLKSLNMATEGNNTVYAKADGHNGSILNISPTAAEAFNTSEIITNTTLKGKYQVNGQANFRANQHDILIVTAPSESGGVVNGRGATAENIRTDNSETAVRLSGVELQAESANLAAHNDLRINVFHSDNPAEASHSELLDKHVYGVYGDSGAVLLDATHIKFTNKVTEKALLDLQGAKVQTSGDLKLVADTTNEVFAAGRGNTGSMLAAGIGVTVDNTFNYSDVISLDKNSSLQTTSAAGRISLSAVDDSTLQVGSYANSKVGVETVPVAKTYNTTTRTNQLELNGKIDSANTLHLYAGQYDSTAMSGLHAVIDVQTYSGSLIIPASARTMKNNITENNLVNINSGASVRSVASTDIYANEGALYIHENNIGSCLYADNKHTSSYVVLSKTTGSAEDVGLTQNNKVNLNGSVVAGYNHELKLTLGKVGEIVILDADQRKAFMESNPELADRVTATPTITASGSLTAAQWQQLLGYETANIVADLMERYDSLQTALANYSSDKTSQAYVALRGALDQVRDQLSKMGMLVKGGADGTEEIVLSSLKTDAVTLPDIAVSGGNVTVQTGSLLGSGSLEAYGKPIASIINNTNLYMKLNNINVGEAGGVLSVNGTKMAASDNAAALNAAIAQQNANKAAPSFNKIHCEDGAGGTLEVKNTFAGRDAATENMDYTVVAGRNKEGNPVTTHIRFLPDIEVQAGKSITNASGKLTMDNLRGNLLVNGEINARDVVLSAVNGSIYQNSLEEGKGLINIGGEVMGSIDDTSHAVKQPAESSGRIAGSNIFLNALTININGLIQSGYADYSASIDSNYSAAIANLDNLYNQGKLGKLTDDQVLLAGTDSAYCLNPGGGVYNATTKQYDYQVPLYYNPRTGTILVDEIRNGGGNIYLSGIISSTGNGRILAMDGTADVTINNATNKDVRLYGINTSFVQGKVTLLDTQKGKQTVITRDKVVVSDLDGSNPTTTDNSGSYTYDPADYLRYVWVEGVDTTTRTYKERKYEADWWGLHDTKNGPPEDAGVVEKSTITLKDDGKGNYTSIEVDDGSKDTEDGYTVYDNYKFKEKVLQVSKTVSDVTVTRWETGLYGYRKHELYEWYVDEGTTSSIKHSVAASKPIAVGFIGKGETDSHIKVDSIGTVDINGNIGSSAANAIISITSAQGGINQDKGLLKGNNIELSAAGKMDGINILSDSQLNLKATNTATAGMTYYHQGVGSKISDGNSIDITVETAAVQQGSGTDYGKVLLKGSSGNVADNRLVESFSLKANGSIEQDADAEISAAKISLTAVNGGIGTVNAVRVNTADTPLNSHSTLSASLNAQAQGNINLYETKGNMRLGTVYSDAGDVTLGGVGSLVDALPYDTAQDSGRSRDELVELWTSLGLTKDGWDTDKLLYAISDKLINPHSGLTTSSKAPNIKAHNITLNMADSAGLLSEETFTYKISELGSKADLSDLQMLARADASSVVWDEANDLVTIHQKLPVGIQLVPDATGAAGVLTISAGKTDTAEGNAFVEGRTEQKTGTQMDLYIKDITAKGSVLLNNALGSIFNAPSAGMDAVIKAAMLDINAGGAAGVKGFLGTADNPLRFTINGPLRATATDGIYLYQTGDNNLYLQNVSSGGDIQLTADKDILVYLLNGVETGYLRLENGGEMRLVSNEGSLGEKEHRLSVKNAEDEESEVIAKAEKDIYLEGVTTEIDGQTAGGKLNVWLENGADTEIVDVQVNGTLNLLNESLTAKNTINLGAVNGMTLIDKELKTTAPDGTVALNAGSMTTGHGYASKNNTADLNLVSGLVSSAKINLTSTHDIIQTYSLKESGLMAESGHVLEAQDLLATAAGNMDLGSGLNRLNTVTLDNRAGAGANNAVILGNDGMTDVNVTATNTLAGQGGMIHGTVTINKYQDTTGGVVPHTLRLVSVQADGAVKANNNQDSIENYHTLSKDDISLQARKNVYNKGRLEAEGKIDLVSLEQHIVNSPSDLDGAPVSIIDGKRGVEMWAKRFVVNNSELHSSAGDIVLRADEGIFNIDDEYMTLEQFDDKYLNTSRGNIMAAGSVIMETSTTAGHIGDENDRIINVGKITAQGKISTTVHKLGEREWWQNLEDVLCKGNVIIHSYGDITNYGDITTQVVSTGETMPKDAGSIILDSWGSINNHGQMTAANSVEQDATQSVLNVKHIEAQQHVYITSYEAGVKNTGNIIANNDEVKMAAVETIRIGKEQFDESISGDIHNTGTIRAGKDVTLATYNGALINKKSILTDTGNVTLTAKVYPGTTATTPGLGDISNTGDIFIVHDGNVELNGDDIVTNSGNFTIGDNGNITIHAGNDVFNGTQGSDADNGNMEISGKGNITMQVDKGTIYNYKGADMLTADGNVTLAAVSDAFDVYFYDADNKKQSLRKMLAAGAITQRQFDDVVLSEHATTKITGADGTEIYEGKVFIDGSVFNSGDIMAIGGKIALTSLKGDVYNFDDFNTLSSLSNGSKTGQYVKSGGSHGVMISTGDIDLRSPEGLLYNQHELISDGNITMEAARGLDSLGQNIYAGGNVSLIATQGDLFNLAKIVSLEGDVNLKAENGAVVNMLNADIFAMGGSVNILAGGRIPANDVYTATINGVETTCRNLYTVDDVGNVTKLAADVDANKKIVVDKYYLVGGTGEAKLIDDTVVKADLSAAEQASIYGIIKEVIRSKAIAGQDKKDEELKELTDRTGNVLKVMGDIEVYRLGDVVNRGDVVALGKTEKQADGSYISVNPGTITLESAYSNASNYDNFRYADGKETYDFKGEEIYNPGTKFYKGKKYMISAGNLTMAVDEGYIYNKLNFISSSDATIRAKKDIDVSDYVAGVVAGQLVIHSTNGNITNDADLGAGKGIVIAGAKGLTSTGNLTTAAGVLRLSAEEGDINLTGTISAGGSVDSDGNMRHGSVDIGAAAGNVNAAEANILASDLSAVGAKEGNITVGNIKGDEVILYSNGVNKTVKAKEVTVKDYLVLRGDVLEIENIIGTDNGGWFNVDVTGANGGATRGDVRLNAKGNVHFSTLSAERADINITDGGKLAMEKLHIVDKGYFNAMDYVTAVYGTPVYKESSPAVYFDVGDGKGASLDDKLQLERLLFGTYGTDSDDIGESPSYKKPAYIEEVRKQLAEQAASIGNFTLDNDGWMNLYIDTPNFQRSNGILLNLKDYYYVNNQRYAANDFATMLADTKAVNVYTCYFKDPVGYFDRYNLIDMQGVTMVPYGDMQPEGNGLITVADDAAEEEKKILMQ